MNDFKPARERILSCCVLKMLLDSKVNCSVFGWYLQGAGRSYTWGSAVGLVWRGAGRPDGDASRWVYKLRMCVKKDYPGLDFIIKDLPSVLILIIAYQTLNDSLCCSNKYNWCVCRFIGKQYILLLTFLINLSEICIIVHERILIKFKPD